MDYNTPIVYFNRLSGREETEKVLGEKHLKRLYSTFPGKIALHLLIKRALFSKMYGYQMNKPRSREKISDFITSYGVNEDDFVTPPGGYASFNDFFYRKLRTGARPIDPSPDIAVFPADARHLGFQDISKVEGIFIKGQTFDLPALLGSSELAEQYANGSLIISRLCPIDYHRFHFPVEGTPGETKIIPGPLASVSPFALRRRVSWLWTNKRTLTRLQSDRWGQVLLIDVGATCVGSITQTFTPSQVVQKGDEKGFFAFGGSTVITLFEPNKITLCDDLVEHSAHCRELYAHMGTPMGKLST